MSDEVKLFSPATVANVACGFDVLGFCLDYIGDEMVIRKTDNSGITITKIEGFDLPMEAEKNVAGISALALYNYLNPDCGFEIEIYKHIKPGSGIGSSAASAAGSVFGINELLGRPVDKTQLTYFAMKGEAMASQCEHADNLAPAIFGGFTLVKSIQPLKIIELPTPQNLFATIIHPQIEIKTSEARSLLPDHIPMQDGIKQWANLGGLIHALHTSDYDLIKSTLHDEVIEPHRKALIPNFDLVKFESLKAGALGCGISGSGPSIFALCKSRDTAEKVGKAMESVYKDTGIDVQTYVSNINTQGIKLL